MTQYPFTEMFILPFFFLFAGNPSWAYTPQKPYLQLSKVLFPERFFISLYYRQLLNMNFLLHPSREWCPAETFEEYLSHTTTFTSHPLTASSCTPSYIKYTL